MRCQRTQGNDIRFFFFTFHGMEMDNQVIWHEDSYGCDKHFEIDGDWSLVYQRLWGWWLVSWDVRQPLFNKTKISSANYKLCWLFDFQLVHCSIPRVVLVWYSVERKKEFIFKFNLTEETLDSFSRCIAIIESNHI